MAYKPSKPGQTQTDLVFGLWSKFISESKQTGFLQNSTCSVMICASLHG